MVEGPTNMLGVGVFINLVYIHTIPINHYSCTYMMSYYCLVAKHCLKVGRKSKFCQL